MRTLMTVVVGLALMAALWVGGPGQAFADDKGNGQGNCDAAQPFVPGSSVGPLKIGMPLEAVPRLFGRPRSVENRSLQNHQWTHMLYAGVDVLARDNKVVALNLPQLAGFSLPASCGVSGARPYRLPIGYVRQTYGPPSSSLVLNGLQYWLYNALGLLLTVPINGGFVQGIAVYPAGQYCSVAPVLVSFGGYLFSTGATAPCGFDPADRER